MLKELRNEQLNNAIKEMIEVFESWIKPKITFVLTKESKKGRKNIVGVYDQITDRHYFVIDNCGIVKILNLSEVQYAREMVGYFRPCMAYYVLHTMNKGYQLTYMDLNCHTLIWNFIDEYLEDVVVMENGLYSYLLFCEETDISYKTLVYQSDFMVLTDILYHFYQIDFREYGVVLYQPVGNQYLLLGTNFDKQGIRYYGVLLLNSKREIVERKHYVHFEDAISDFKNKFYHFKILEHGQTETLIKSAIDEHINFLKERGEEVK